MTEEQHDSHLTVRETQRTEIAPQAGSSIQDHWISFLSALHSVSEAKTEHGTEAEASTAIKTEPDM